MLEKKNSDTPIQEPIVFLILCNHIKKNRKDKKNWKRYCYGNQQSFTTSIKRGITWGVPQRTTQEARAKCVGTN